jgi:hypothetical protein
MKWTADSLNGRHEIEWTVTTDNKEDAERLHRFLVGDGTTSTVTILFKGEGADKVRADVAAINAELAKLRDYGELFEILRRGFGTKEGT